MPHPEIELPRNEVHLWTAKLSGGSAATLAAEKVLSAQERDRAGRFLKESDRQKYIICHGKVREILARYVPVSAKDLVFEADGFGKPCFLDLMNPDRIQFNLSHSGSRMALGVVRKARIGVDIEERRSESASLEVAGRFFTPRENADLLSLSESARVEGFFNCWTRKEAYLKAVGCGLSANPTEMEVSLKPGEVAAIRRQLTSDSASNWTLFHFVDDDYTGAVAVDLPAAELKRKSG